ncbi:hypothetical protein KMT30_05920 [Streptomyces sp. IBSBF 2953]|nr:hypothetical protein [Streptomyces hayashii]
MKLIAVIFEPAQQVAAEPATLDQLTATLRTQLNERLKLALPSDQLGSLFGWPLVYDERIPPGFVHLRPHPTPPHPDEQTEEVNDRG